MTSILGLLRRLPRRERYVVDGAQPPSPLPASFVWGTATADHQIENAQDDDWTAFEKKTRRAGLEQAGPDGHPLPGHLLRAVDDDEAWFAKKADFDRLMEADLDRAKDIGSTSFRFSISMVRLFPTETTIIPDPAGLAFYDRLFAALEARGLSASVTLFHFALPRWLSEAKEGRRGVERADAPAHFERFVRVVVERWGAQVFQWCTLNEPTVYCYLGYLDGVFPPNERRGHPKHVTPVIIGLLKMHAVAWAAIKARHPDAIVGVATHVRRFMPWRNRWILDRVTAAIVDQAFHHDFLEAIETGVYRSILSGGAQEVPGLRAPPTSSASTSTAASM